MRFFNVWLPSDNGQFRMTEGPHGVKHVLVSIRQIIIRILDEIPTSRPSHSPGHLAQSATTNVPGQHSL